MTPLSYCDHLGHGLRVNIVHFAEMIQPKHVLIPIFASSMILPVAALPVQVSEGVAIEAAFLRPADRGAELFLVVNNRSDAAIELTRVDAAVVTGTLLAPDDPQETLSIPFYSELYMTEDGLKVTLPVSFSANQAVPVTIATSAGSATVEAVVLDAGAELPDHHDYVH